MERQRTDYRDLNEVRLDILLCLYDAHINEKDKLGINYIMEKTNTNYVKLTKIIDNFVQHGVVTKYGSGEKNFKYSLSETGVSNIEFLSEHEDFLKRFKDLGIFYYKPIPKKKIREDSKIVAT